MTRRELIAAVAAAEGITAKEAELAVKTVFASFEKTLINEDRVEIRGFGSFKVKAYRRYQGRNPKTGDIIEPDFDFELADLYERHGGQLERALSEGAEIENLADCPGVHELVMGLSTESGRRFLRQHRETLRRRQAGTELVIARFQTEK